jgi:CRISP-associated protein Cas1
MTNRILDFSQAPARLSYSNGLLVVAQGANPDVTVPLLDITAVILSHPQISISAPLLGQLAAQNVALICCDEKMRPSGMLLPIEAMNQQANRFRAQVALSVPKKKRLWQEIVRAKILAQAQVLNEFYGSDYGLNGFAKRVQSGDPKNVEAHAARRYWSILWPTESFRRSNEDDPRNHLLNYGYAVLRAIVARSLCASGLHPSFELHHHNVHNTFPLADDLMEPFRPAVDRTAMLLGLRLEEERQLTLDSTTKRVLLEVFTSRFTANGESRTMMDHIQRTAQSLASVVAGEAEQLDLPHCIPEKTESAKLQRKSNASSSLQNHVAVRNVRSAS